ncbi:uncharacterized protein LOC116013752 [Ipomoea triloba]|uniref:uncharacterized protein LOC116013752 n=1 Tax=Ipomoea triloba TaxID=35885 RepID=UPI00125D5236|nr:uncharacterized protein LOC116013752 [Ipomoea triloba]
MEACLFSIKPTPTPRIKISPVPALPRCVHGGSRRLQRSTAVKCGGGGSSVPELERKLEEELAGMGRERGKCYEVNGVAELLECLEREAIMGDDEGRDPNDYNRRAQIFDKSSRIFQALKENSSSSDAILDSSPD